MTIPDHFQLQPGSPIYCLDWLSDDVLVYAGGGGRSRTGVGNYIRALHVPRDAKSPADVKVLAELKLSSQEDAPMSMAVQPRGSASTTATLVLGINEADESKLTGNEHLRVFTCQLDRTDDKSPKVTLTHQSSAPSLPLKDAAESYLRLLAFSPAGDQLLSASTDGNYALHEYPSLKPVFAPTQDFIDQEIMDADFSQDGSQLVLCTGTKLKVFGTYPSPAGESGDNEKGDGNEDKAVSKTDATLAINQSLGLGPKSSEADVSGTNAVKSAAATRQPPVWQTIQNPALGGEGGCEFRAVRFGRRDVTGSEEKSQPSKKLFTVVNAKSQKGGNRKAKRKAFLTSWTLKPTSPSLELTRQLSEKPVTACALSSTGKLLAYGSSDLSVGIVDAQSLRVVGRILNAHGFPATRVAWSPRGQGQTQTWLASASADGTLRIVSVNEEAMGSATNHAFLLTLLLTFIILLLALYIQKKSLV